MGRHCILRNSASSYHWFSLTTSLCFFFFSVFYFCLASVSGFPHIISSPPTFSSRFVVSLLFLISVLFSSFVKELTVCTHQKGGVSLQVAHNTGPSNMHIPVFFDHNRRLMFHSSCLVGFHTKAQRISSFYHFLTQRFPWYSWSVCCGWLIFSSFSAWFYSSFSRLSHCVFLWLSVLFFLPSLDLIVKGSRLLPGLSFISLPQSLLLGFFSPSVCSSLGMSSHCSRH